MQMGKEEAIITHGSPVMMASFPADEPGQRRTGACGRASYE